MLYGALGAITPYLVAFLLSALISPLDPATASDISEVTGIFMTLACLPTICIGAILGMFFVWLIVKLEKPRRIFHQIEQSDDSIWIFVIGFVGGFLTGPILGLLAIIASAYFGML